MSNIQLEPSWKSALNRQFTQPYWHELTDFVRGEYKKHRVFPPGKNIFRSLDLCPLESVRVVIIGQDPYHGQGQANGLCFAVNDGVRLPPSLQNIFKEIQADLGISPHQSGDLTRWARQGVLLLNSVLTVRAGSPASHAGKGWEQFTDAVIEALSQREHIVYMLWGRYAQKKGERIDGLLNCVLRSAHPSPFSAHLFFGNHHFSQCNEYLRSHDLKEIDWR